ncbi:GMC family oxidoreductase [Egicoccus sp. AB-alg2]|uniref:GMC family oxidoreductase n=1 Tax=Egicoccus sp. AB-alg2 TaxID=3242693 RepID=UPI00359DA02B
MIEHPEVDVVTVGAGWTAGIAAQQLTAQGLTVVSIEKGRAQWTWPDFAHNHDELRFTARHELMHEIERETWTWRPNDRMPSLPMRQYGAFHPGSNVGGAGVHWSAVMWRFLPTDFDYLSHHTERYGRDLLPDGHSNQDWPVGYDELEPHFTQFEVDTGMSGQTGNLNGEILEGGNPYEGPRSRPYPLPPLAPTRAGLRFAEAAEALGYTPFVQPSSILSEGYTDMSGEPRAGCVYCGFCTRYGCHVDAKSSALTAHIPMALDTGRYEIRTRCYVTRIPVDDTGLATGIEYLGPDGREHFQPARTVLVSGYTMSNVRLLMLSTSDAHPDGIGNARGQLGRNATHQIWQQPTIGRFDGERFNTYMGNTSTSHAIYDFAGDVFDHSGLGFIGGGQLFADAGERLPIGTVEGIPTAQGEGAETADGEPREWGQAFKDRIRHWDSYIPITMQAESPAYEFNRFDLDPTYTDFLGRPLLRITFDWTDNERRMYAFIAERAMEIMDRMQPTARVDNPEIEPYNVVDYQSTHIQGGAIMGTDPSNSVTNRYGQVWDAPNVVVTGAALFPQNPGANPTATVNALMYHTLEAMREQNYFRAPGELLS